MKPSATRTGTSENLFKSEIYVLKAVLKALKAENSGVDSVFGGARISILLAILFLLNTSLLHAGNLKIHVTNINPILGGHILFALYNGQEGFLNRESVVGGLRIEAERKSIQGTYTDIFPGLYSVAVFHDSNDSGILDRFFGIPTEGYGFSRIHQKILRKPSFKETSLRVGLQETVTIVIPIHYSVMPGNR